MNIENDRSSIGIKLGVYRERKGIRVKDIESDAGIHRKYVNRIENGESVHIDTWMKYVSVVCPVILSQISKILSK